MASMKSKVRGMMLGVALGDALGQPHENKSPLGYPVMIMPDKGGQTTDDWQMTAVLARSLMESGGVDMDNMVKHHVAAYEKTTRGWGGAHRDACAALKKGMPWSDSGKMVLSDDKPYRGRGNGMCMKISPLAGFHFARAVALAKKSCAATDHMNNMADLTMMTHPTSIGLASTAGMERALFYCLGVASKDFDPIVFLSQIEFACYQAENWVKNETGSNGDKLSDRIGDLKKEDWNKISPEEIYEKYKGGGYAYESLPFSLAFFCLGNHDESCVYDCVGSGGDTDTNGSMVGALAGALHGEEIFPKNLLYKIIDFDDIDSLSENFANWCVAIGE